MSTTTPAAGTMVASTPSPVAAALDRQLSTQTLAAPKVGPKEGPPVKFGITDPISLQEPTEADLELTEKMLRELQEIFPSESPKGMLQREAVLEELERMVSEWMVEAGVESGLSKEEAGRGLLSLFTLGSYRLGVVHPGSDIDALCIGPPHVTREAFFTSLVAKLEKHKQVSECVPIPDAYTPIIKLKMDSVYIDLLFARLVVPLAEDFKPEDLYSDEELLKNMDDKSVRCMNGYRVAELILQLVPDAEAFRKTLRFVKCWARRRGIYSNVSGFFGGITWALLVARVCQLYPYYSPSQLVNRFFRVYDQWNWSKPVLLTSIEEKDGVAGLTGFKVWNPKTNQGDRLHIMPVITPAFPAMNSTHNVTETTKRILLDEFRRGYEVVKTVESTQREWNDVHAAFPFFQSFGHFIWLEILAKTDEVFGKFSGWIESKVRILTKQLEGVPGMVIHPNPQQYFLNGSDPEWPSGCAMFIGMTFCRDQGAFPGMTIDLRPAISQFLDVINQWFEKDTFINMFLLRAKRIKQSELPSYVEEAKGLKRPSADSSVADSEAAGAGETALKKPRTNSSSAAA